MTDFEAVILLFATIYRPALGPKQPPIQRVTEGLSLAVKRPERETDNLPPSSAEDKNVWSFTSTPAIGLLLHGMVLRHRDMKMELISS
jgi:hypothetical protein